MPTPNITERRDESPQKNNPRGKSLQNAGNAAIKGLHRPSRTEQTSPTAGIQGSKTSDFVNPQVNEDYRYKSETSSPLFGDSRSRKGSFTKQKAEEQRFVDYTDMGQRYITELRQEFRPKEVQDQNASVVTSK